MLVHERATLELLEERRGATEPPPPAPSETVRRRLRPVLRRQPYAVLAGLFAVGLAAGGVRIRPRAAGRLLRAALRSGLDSVARELLARGL